MNQNGQVIGINVAYLPPAQTGAESIGFAIPAQTAAQTADQIISTGHASNPYLGVSLSEVSQETAKQFNTKSGALVAQVRPGEPAAQAGIKQGDIITAIGGQKVKNTGDLLSELRRYQPGDSVDLTVTRNNNEITRGVTLGQRSKPTVDQRWFHGAVWTPWDHPGSRRLKATSLASTSSTETHDID